MYRLNHLASLGQLYIDQYAIKDQYDNIVGGVTIGVDATRTKAFIMGLHIEGEFRPLLSVVRQLRGEYPWIKQWAAYRKKYGTYRNRNISQPKVGKSPELSIATSLVRNGIRD